MFLFDEQSNILLSAAEAGVIFTRGRKKKSRAPEFTL